MPFFPLTLLGLSPWLLAVIAFVIGRQRKSSNTWSPLVIQEWRASNEPDADGRFVHIRGRSAGVFSWLLSALSLDEDISVAVFEGRVEFEESSLFGKKRIMIPLSSLSSTEYGYHKPWKGAVIVFFIAVILIAAVLAVNGSNGAASTIVGLVIGALVSTVFYVLNRSLRLGFLEHSGRASGIQFKKSIIENMQISEVQAGYVCLLIQSLIENMNTRK